jgi:hypothetical protein
LSYRHRFLLVALAFAQPTITPALAAPRTPPCPTDLSLDSGAATIDLTTADSVDAKTHARRHFARDHQQPLAREFALAGSDAVDRVIAIEQRAPGLVPAGFRDAVAANPRDKLLRYRMAQCEAAKPATRRRAGDDAALAFLLGAAGGLAVTADIARDTPPLVHGVQATPAQQAFYAISADEAAIEDALTRGLYGVHAPALPTWGSRWIHACDAATCLLKPDPKADPYATTPKLVHWDIRDGGIATPADTSHSSLQTGHATCRAHTGEETLETCQYMCGTRASDQRATCNASCASWCQPRAFGE